MKKIKFFLLALCALVGSSSVWATTYQKVTASGTLGTMTLSELQTAVSTNGSAMIALGILSNTASSYGTTDGPNYYFSADANKVKTLEDKNVFTIELVSGSTNTYTLKTQAGAYIASGSNGGTVTTTTDVSSAAKFTLSTCTPGDYDSKYASADKIRFTQNSTYLNCQERTTSSGWRTGAGGYSAYVVWKIETQASNVWTVVTNPSDKGGITITSTSETKANGDTFTSDTTPVEGTDFTVNSVENYGATCVVSESANTVTVTYKFSDIFEEGKVYSLRNDNWNECELYEVTTDYQAKGREGVTSDPEAQWLVTSVAGDGTAPYYIRNVNTGRYLQLVASNNTNWYDKKSTETTDNAKFYFVYNSDNGIYSISTTSSLDNGTCVHMGSNADRIVRWNTGATSGGSRWKTYPIDVEYDIYDIVVTGLTNNDAISVTSAADHVGMASLSNGEAFFFPKGTSVTAGNFSAPDQDNYSKEITLEGNVVKVKYLSEAATYNVVVTGCDAGRVVYDTQEYANGSSIENVVFDYEKLSLKDVAGYSLTRYWVDGQTIHALYIPDPAFSSSLFVTNIGDELDGTNTTITPNTQWYLLKQQRGELTPVYDKGNGTALCRAASDCVTVNANSQDYEAYFVRFVTSDAYPSTDGIYNIQFGTGRYFSSSLTSSSTPASFFVYPASTTNATGHFAINLTTDGTNYGSRVDNNGDSTGSEHSLSFWGSGHTESGTNNIWALYPVTLDEIELLTYTVHIYGAPGVAKVTVGGTDYADGNEFTCAPITASAVTSSAFASYGASIVLNGTDINVTYYVNSTDAFQNGKAFYANTSRGFMYSQENGTLYSSYTVAFEGVDADKQFAIIKSQAGNLYLYSISEQKFAYYSNDLLVKLAELPQAEGLLTLASSANDTYNWLFKINSHMINVTASGGTGIYVGWDVEDEGNEWQFIYASDADLSAAVALVEAYENPVDITITDAGWATACVPFDATVTGATAYKVNVDGESLVKTELEGTIPAGTGVLLATEGRVAGTATFTLATGAETVADNLLVGNATASPVDLDESGYLYYKLCYGSEAPNVGVLGFFWGATDGTSITCPAYKAVLKVSESAGIKGFTLDDETAIANIDGSAELTTQRYNLAGQRVNAGFKGIVIENGKKVLR